MKRWSFIVAILMLGVNLPSFAQKNVAQTGKELNKVQSNIKQLNQNIHQIRGKQDSLSKQLRKIEKQYGKTAGSLHELKLKIKQKKQRLKDIQHEVQQRQADAKLQSHELSGQIKAAYIMGKKEKLKLLLNQQDPALASRMLVYYQYLNQARLKELAIIKANLEQLEQLKTEKKQEQGLLTHALKLRETEKVDLAKTKKQREGLLKHALKLRETEKVDLAKTKKQRKHLLSKLNRDFKSKSKQLNSLVTDEKQLQQVIVRLEKQALKREKEEQEQQRLAEQKHQQVLAERKRAEKERQKNLVLAKRKAAKLKQHQAKLKRYEAKSKQSQKKDGFLAEEPRVKIARIDKKSKPKPLILASKSKPKKYKPFSSTSGQSFYKQKGRLPWPIAGKLVKKFGSRRSDTRWDGVLIAAKEGADIRAVTTGKIVFADWLRGYGLLVIIDHGKGYMTLYAFNQSLYKKKGDRVKAGTVIAAVGKSGGRTKSGLYFGVRKRGKAVNPVKWCRKVRDGYVS